ncbi:MAG TPA: metallophosphoesterase [Mycobacteriales bacterium]|nr:metallophosphoesterase [Mycobacteriales bacterium]
MLPPDAHRLVRTRIGAILASRRVRRRIELVVLALGGAVLGVLVGGVVHARIGPVETRFALRPSLTGGTEIDVAPLGAIAFDSHDGPARLHVDVTRLRVDAARRIFADPDTLAQLGDRVAADLRAALWRLGLQALLAAAVGAALVVLPAFRRLRPVLVAAGIAVVTVAGAGLAGLATWNSRALGEPRYTGLLTSAPAVVGNAQDIVRRFSAYQKELATLVTNVSRLYDVTSTLPAYSPDRSTIRLLHVSDLHLNPAAWDLIRSVVQQFSVDVVVDSGDITDHGSRPEDRYVAEIARVAVPYVYIRGNHDARTTEAAVRRNPNAVVLSGSAATVAGLRFFGDGDPRFTPDRTTRESPEAQRETLDRFGRRLGARLAAGEPPPVDVALVHDPLAARLLDGLAPLMLAGHVHRREVQVLPEGTWLMVQGSTGGAGLRGLEGEQPTPFALSVLYVDRETRTLRAWDEVTVGRLGNASVQVQRRMAEDRPRTATVPGAAGGG